MFMYFISLRDFSFHFWLAIYEHVYSNFSRKCNNFFFYCSISSFIYFLDICFFFVCVKNLHHDSNQNQALWLKSFHLFLYISYCSTPKLHSNLLSAYNVICIRWKNSLNQHIFKVFSYITQMNGKQTDYNLTISFSIEKSKYALCTAIHTLILPYYHIIYLIWVFFFGEWKEEVHNSK